jgi:hypothetical protein
MAAYTTPRGLGIAIVAAGRLDNVVRRKTFRNITEVVLSGQDAGRLMC